MTAGYQLPTDPLDPGGLKAMGFGTPSSDTSTQVWFEPPRRVIPIVFLPGIMGSNLKITDGKRIELLGRDKKDAASNIAWRPDTINVLNAWQFSNRSAAERQLLLDPETTAVDVYNPGSSRPDLDGDERNRNVALASQFSSPLLQSDPAGTPNAKTAAQKARIRGWGEVYFGSYGELLQRIESKLQRIFVRGELAAGWETVIGVDPATWRLDPSTPQQALSVEELKAITKGTYFPVHAIGYNWLVSNRRSAQDVARQVRRIVTAYREAKPSHACPGVIVVTHSLGGLVGRALIHPNMGGLQDLVLGMVHGVQPATGAAAAYRRMHAGFEDPGLAVGGESSVTAKVAGNYGDEVTAVLASSPGGLQLLPSKAYGDGWLRIAHDGRELARLPAKGDPYEEIYKLRGKWFGLFANESWIDPASAIRGKGSNTLEETFKRIDTARQFHDELADDYHPNTYAHYGADPNHRAFGDVTWQISAECKNTNGWREWPVVANNRQGTVTFVEAPSPLGLPVDAPWTAAPLPVIAKLDPPDESGDQTVPIRSADRQLQKGRCKAVFRQAGYEHQGSYKNEAVLSATLFSILRIAQGVQL